MDRIYFKIGCIKNFNGEVKSVETDFYLDFEEYEGCVDGMACNPTSTWTNYTQWDNGWTEQDDDLNTLWGAVKEYSKTMELEELIGSMDECDIGKSYSEEYKCESFCEPENNCCYDYKVTINDIEVVSNDE